MMRRSDVPEAVSRSCGGRPVRWLATAAADFDGADRALEVFEADAREQMPLLRALRTQRDELAVAAGGPIVILFHTRRESLRLHAAFVDAWHAARADEARRAEQRARLADVVSAWIRDPATVPSVDPDAIDPLDLGRAA